MAPNIGWIKLNFDGATKCNPGAAGSGGVFRDLMDQPLGLFVSNCGNSTNNLAEAWALWKGISLARNCGLKRLWVEGDSKFLIEAIQGMRLKNWKLGAIVEAIISAKRDFEDIFFT